MPRLGKKPLYVFASHDPQSSLADLGAQEQAKLALMAKDKEKKRKRRAPMATPTTPTAQVKRVGFA